MKFKENSFIVHENGTEMVYRVVVAIGADELKEVYFGLWLTRKTNPHISIAREYISINKQDLKKWKTIKLNPTRYTLKY